MSAVQAKEYTRTTIRLTVLSERPLTDEERHDVGFLAWAIDEGPMVGMTEVLGAEELTARQMADALSLAGSDGSFFDIEED